MAPFSVPYCDIEWMDFVAYCASMNFIDVVSLFLQLLSYTIKELTRSQP